METPKEINWTDIEDRPPTVTQRQYLVADKDKQNISISMFHGSCAARSWDVDFEVRYWDNTSTKED